MDDPRTPETIGIAIWIPCEVFARRTPNATMQAGARAAAIAATTARAWLDDHSIEGAWARASYQSPSATPIPAKREARWLFSTMAITPPKAVAACQASGAWVARWGEKLPLDRDPIDAIATMIDRVLAATGIPERLPREARTG